MVCSATSHELRSPKKNQKTMAQKHKDAISKTAVEKKQLHSLILLFYIFFRPLLLSISVSKDLADPCAQGVTSGLDNGPKDGRLAVGIPPFANQPEGSWLKRPVAKMWL